ncbi:MAG: hypothetical protein NTV43_02080 [Methylococcales bacterium]|nr:hypothetical protein [Methylococcales bacterium]
MLAQAKLQIERMILGVTHDVKKQAIVEIEEIDKPITISCS